MTDLTSDKVHRSKNTSTPLSWCIVKHQVLTSICRDAEFQVVLDPCFLGEQLSNLIEVDSDLFIKAYYEFDSSDLVPVE